MVHFDDFGAIENLGHEKGRGDEKSFFEKLTSVFRL